MLGAYEAAPPVPVIARATETPFTEAELDRLFAPIAGLPAVILAVSGGPDSLAMLDLAARWRRARADGPRLLAATVDHGLRPASRAEAEAVGELARGIGVEHLLLRWTGDKPANGIQAAARAARYRLLAEAALARSCRHILTAHTANDQAETVLMRLARGSGVDGLSAMAAQTVLEHDGLLLLRPLLGIAKVRLTAHLRRTGLAWAEDPSNCNLQFERVRLRAEAAALERAGLDSAALCLSARRLERARIALELAAAALATEVVRLDPAGYAEIVAAGLAAAPAELGLRVLSAVLATVGGRRPVALARLEALFDHLTGWTGPTASRTLAGCEIRPGPCGAIRVIRERRRRGLPVIGLAPGAEAVWDGRFLVALDGDEALSVGALSAVELAMLRRTRPQLRDLPARVALAVPAFRAGGRLIAVPALGFVDDRCRSTFPTERRYSL